MQVISILAVISGEFDVLPLDKIREAEKFLHSQMTTTYVDLLSKIKESKSLDDDVRTQVLAVVKKVVESFK